jgi:hypothetical protein
MQCEVGLTQQKGGLSVIIGETSVNKINNALTIYPQCVRKASKNFTVCGIFGLKYRQA